MRISRSLLLMAATAFVLTAPQQSMATSVNFVQLNAGENGSAVCDSSAGTCTGDVGDILTLALTIEVGAAGLRDWSFDVEWDNNLANALTLDGSAHTTSFIRGFLNSNPPPEGIGYTSLAPIVTYQSTGAWSGAILRVSGGSAHDPNLTISSTSFRAGTLTFSIDNTNETEIVTGFFREGANMIDSASQSITPGFASWIINQSVPEPTPEPGTTLLMGLGLFGLAIAGRRKR